MKKLFALIFAVVMLISVFCASAEMPLEGGWTPSETYEVTEEHKALFDQAMEKLLGVDYIPVAYLGSQVVAGTNHCFLAQAKVVVPDAQPAYKLVFLYQKLDGTVEILSIADFDFAALLGFETSAETPMVGGWIPSEAAEITEKVKALFDKALEGLLGVDYAPVALLGTQIVAGTNYCILAHATVVVPGTQPAYKLISLYAKLDGTVELTDIVDFDFGAFCDYGAE